MTNPKLCLALDVSTLQEAKDLVHLVEPYVGVYKVGLELFCSVGMVLPQWLASKGLRVFLDLKLHDIPETVARAITTVGRQYTCGSVVGPDYMTVHASGGPAMLWAAKNAAKPFGIRLLAVTVLTSLGSPDLLAMGFSNSDQMGWVDPTPIGVAKKLTRMAYLAGIDGFVCSAQEVAELSDDLGDGFFVTPGIRLPEGDKGDQVRVGTPERAIADGASMLVVGRPIRDAKDPREAAKEFSARIHAGLST